MAKHRITFDVDGSEMFDAMKLFGPDASAHVGFALSSVLMTGEAPGFGDAARMKACGMDFVSSEKL